MTAADAAGLAGLAVLAADAEDRKAGPVALLIIVLLGVALVFLVRSMNTHLKRVPPSFEAPPRPGPEVPEGSGPGAGAVDAEPLTRPGEPPAGSA